MESASNDSWPLEHWWIFIPLWLDIFNRRHIKFGVPIIAMPTTVEQPLNGRVQVENGVAVEIMRDENGRLEREEIAKMINHVVIGGCRGNYEAENKRFEEEDQIK